MLISLLFFAALVAMMVLLVRDQRKLHAQRRWHRNLAFIERRSSKRLALRLPERTDRDFYVEMASDPTAAEANGWSQDEAATMQTLFADKEKFKNFRLSELVAVERSSRSRAATVTFTSSRVGPPGARAVGVHVHPDHRNKGYGREAMAAGILVMQQQPGPVYVGTHVSNIGMQRIMQQLGFEADPDTHPYLAPDGQTYESYWYQCGLDTHPPEGLFEV